MKKHNKLSKIISMIITVCMLISICSVSVVFADGDRIYADATYDYYKTVDTSADASNTFGIYMEPQHANLVYHTSAFVSHGYDTATFAAIAWPPELKERTGGDGFPAQNATITRDGSDYIVRSKSSKVKYRMPARITPTEVQVSSGNSFDLKETMIIDYLGTYSGGITRGISGKVPIGKSYEKIHVLVGHAGTLTDSNPVKTASKRIGQFQAHVVYEDEDGTTTLPEEIKPGNLGWAPIDMYSFPEELVDADASDGRNGYVCETLPLVTAEGQSKADNFVADFVSYVSPTSVKSTSKTTYKGQFSTANSNTTHAAFEYTLKLDPTKVVKEIVFSQTSGRGGYTVLGISGENEREDWTDKVAEINAAIDNLERNGANSQASDVAQTMAMINSAVEAGADVEREVNIDKFNRLFSNDEFTKNLVDAMLQGIDKNEETGEFEVTWDDTTDKFKDLDDVASVIEETGNLEECSAREDILNTYRGMVDSLINEEKKDNDEMLQRFELLKSAKTDEFQIIFEEKLIYNKTAPSISTTPELVTFVVDFSKLVDDAVLMNKDNFEVLCGNEKVNSSWITIKKELTDEGMTRAIIEVLNSQDYSKSYTLNVSKNLKGKNGESWGYQLTKLDNAAAPFEASPKDIQLNKTNRTFNGKITLKNSSSSADPAPCVILIMSYDEKGKCLGTIYALPEEGTVAKGQKDIEFTGILPEGAKEVKCYVYDSVTNMTLLTPPVSIEIPAE